MSNENNKHHSEAQPLRLRLDAGRTGVGSRRLGQRGLLQHRHEGRPEDILRPRERRTGQISRQMPVDLLRMNSASDTFWENISNRAVVATT